MSKWDHYSVIEVTDASFPSIPQVSFKFNSKGFKLVNIGETEVVYSFDGTNVHGKLNPNDNSVIREFPDRIVNKIWFISSSSGYVRISGWGAGGVISQGIGSSSGEDSSSSDNIIEVPLFDVNYSLENGVDYLNPVLTINGITETPVFRYKGGDASASGLPAWGYGPDLDFASAGDDPTYNDGSPLLGANDDSVKFNNGDFFRYDASTTFADITSEDIVMEMVVVRGGLGGIFSKRDSSNHGWVIQDETNDIRLLLSDPDGDNVSIITNALAAGQWIHLMFFVDRSNVIGGAVYINGTNETLTIIGSITDIGTLVTSANLAVGALRFDGVLKSLANVAYVAMWKRDAWLDTHLQAAVAKERFAKLTGVWPQRATGTKVPTVMTRTTTAYSEKIEADGTRRLYYVGMNWPRVVSRPDANGDIVTGYLAEPATTNLIGYSEYFNNWSKGNCTISSDALVGPTGQSTADELHESGSFTSSNAAVGRTASLTDGTTYTFSCWVKAAGRSWVRLAAISAPTATAYFDVTNGIVGTTSGTTAAGMESWGDGWYRCWITYAATGTAGRVHNIVPAEDDNDPVYDSLDDHSLSLYGAQVVAGAVPSSYIITVSSAVATRTADNLYYKGDDGNINADGKGSVYVEALPPVSTAGTHLVNLNDGGSASDRIFTIIDSSGFFAADSRASGGNDGVVDSTINALDGVSHSVMVKWKANSLQLFVDGTSEGTVDTSVDIPDDLDRIAIGEAEAGAVRLDGIVQRVKINKDDS